ncbi:MAG: poly-gamma-glutamate synthase PgsB, partial [Myxococcota bacterium]
MATLVLTCLLGLLVVYLVLETRMHNRRWKRVPIRIHVNGTRGKSSTTRLIAAGLRSTGKTVVAKTTGSTARVILPNGRELPLFRPLGANIREQFRVLRLAAQLEAQILVIECMALQPELQWLSERWFVHATHGVLTNCRPDHLDVMGPTSADVADALAGSIPRSGVLFTGERQFLPRIRGACADRRTELVEATEADVQAIGEEELSGFQHDEHPQNVALALAICERLGANRTEALHAMWDAAPDAGAKFIMHLDFFGRDIIFVNG